MLFHRYLLILLIIIIIRLLLMLGTQHSLVLFMTTLTGVMSCGTAGPFGSVPGMWTH